VERCRAQKAEIVTARSATHQQIRTLRAQRSSDPFLRRSLFAFAAILSASIWIGDFEWDVSERRARNLERFAEEMRPYPLQHRPWDTAIALGWCAELFDDKGSRAAAQTLAISLSAISIAGLFGLALSLPAARTFARPDAWSRASPAARMLNRAGWALAYGATRAFLVALRAIPEYVWAFLLLAALGPTAWVAVLALALHNVGTLGRLGAETVENAEPRVFETLRGVGADRAQIVAFGLWPQLLPRFLLFYFYRWETCVREATVLGMLGIASLGYWIDDARARGHTDELVFWVLLGGAIVMVGDATSALARWAVRRA
jgi:phosphonate transport system permease protein